MGLSIQLLGVPKLERDGAVAAPPRGQKAWALLAYLALSRRPVSRQELAGLLFADAADPLGALRWSISQLRRALAPEGEVEGDPLRLELAAGTKLDVERLLAGSPADPGSVEELGRELLEGAAFATAPAFESWLLIERRRLLGAAETALHEGALIRLAAGGPDDAVALARRTVALDPLEEGNQELLVRSMAAAGDREGARAQAEAAAELFREQLGYEPSPALHRAADRPEPFSRSTAGRPAAARGLLEAGQAAITAGATEAGITSLREACAEAARCRDDALRAETLCAIGIALVHVVRGWDGEGAASLHQALVLAERAGAREVATTAHRELGYIGVLAGRREQALTHLAAAEELAEKDDELAGVLGVRGMQASDSAEYPEAVERLGDSVGRAELAGDRRQVGFSSAMLARVRLLRGELDAATALADRSLEEVAGVKWLAFQPFPETLRAEVDRLRGRTDEAESRFDHAFTLGCRLEDPCWEAFAARGLGLVMASRKDKAKAGQWLEEARTRCVRWPDRYAWAQAYVLDAATVLAIDRGDPVASEMAERLEAVSSRAGLRELTARALVHRGTLGDRDAADAASLVASEIDNPALDAELAQLRVPAAAPATR